MSDRQIFVDTWAQVEAVTKGFVGQDASEAPSDDDLDFGRVSSFSGITPDRLVMASLWEQGEQSNLSITAVRLSDVVKIEAKDNGWSVTIEDPTEGIYETGIPEKTAVALMVGYEAQRQAEDE